VLTLYPNLQFPAIAVNSFYARTKLPVLSHIVKTILPLNSKRAIALDLALSLRKESRTAKSVLLHRVMHTMLVNGQLNLLNTAI
jgi:hypothetical protein